MTDTLPSETVVDAKNDANNQSVPTTPIVDDSAVATLRKEKEQAEMRANQLANQLKAKEDAEAAAKAKQLEEDNQYKELFEQERAKREALETETEEQQRKAAIASAKDKVLGEFSDDTKKLAEELGFDLSGADDADVELFKSKLTKLEERTGAPGNVTPNNPAPRNKVSELSQDELRENLSDEDKFHDIVTKRFPGIASMTNQPRQ